MSGITNPAEPYFKDGLWGWDGTVWRKLPLVWGYSSQVAETLGETKDGNGDFTADSATVAEGEVWVVQHVFLVNWSGVRGGIYLEAIISGGIYLLAHQEVPVARTGVYWTGELTLKEDDGIRVVQAGCVDKDVIWAGVVGYKMGIAE